MRALFQIPPLFVPKKTIACCLIVLNESTHTKIEHDSAEHVIECWKQWYINFNHQGQTGRAYYFPPEWWRLSWPVGYHYLFWAWHFLTWAGSVFDSWWCCCWTWGWRGRLSSSSSSGSVLPTTWWSSCACLATFQAICSFQSLSFAGFILTLVCHSGFGFGFGTWWFFLPSFQGSIWCGFPTIVSSYPITFSFTRNFPWHNHTVWSFLLALLKFRLFRLSNSWYQPAAGYFFAWVH